jgi:iron-sulfur cluster insertion protein
MTTETDTAPTAAAPADPHDGGGLTISDSAAAQIARIVAREGNPALNLRISVSGGGCSGFQYGFSLDGEVKEDDQLFHAEGVDDLVDEVSLELLAGAEIDWVEDLAGAAFQVRNPLAKSACGCGSSFSI